MTSGRAAASNKGFDTATPAAAQTCLAVSGRGAEFIGVARSGLHRPSHAPKP
ncbi:hypothetical protein MGWOODY_Smn3467 [hydrothermal vent metagenome]|uniref:Uncharacterized protein n=1 Tax=hydrothermal vent metagenome TaxID=652676 RepID=A0A170PPP4_9ZZZZ